MINVLSNVVSTFVQYGYTYDYDYPTSTSADAVFGSIMATYTVGILCCCVIWAVIDAVIAYLIFKDAQKNNVENPILWALLSFFLGWLGVIIYLVVALKDARSGKKPVSKVKEADAV